MKMKNGFYLPDVVPAPWQLAEMPKTTPVLLALSGGADSRCLLHVLKKQSLRDGFELVAAHLEHGIRGEESKQDALFCEELAKEYGVRLFLKSESIPDLARQGGKGVEETAREVRYAWFEELMMAHNIPILVTAHHADDQLETVLFRLCRGSGLHGLCGIAPVRNFGIGKLVRPLLQLPRREIVRYCEEEHLKFVQDSTNADLNYSRNYIRAKIVPDLEEIFDNPQERVFRMTKNLSEDENYLMQEAKKALIELKGAEDFLPLRGLQQLPPSIAKRVFALWLPCTTETVHLERLWEEVKRGKDSASVSLPGHIRAVICGNKLKLLPDSWRSTTAVQIQTSYPFSEGLFPNFFDKWKIFVKKLPSDVKVHNLSTPEQMIFHIKTDIIKGEYYWRLPEAGDEFLLGGMHRKIGKLFRERNILPTERKTLPLLCDAQGIFWAPYLGFRDGILDEGDAYEVKFTGNDG